MSLSKWTTHTFSSGGYAGQDYLDFQKAYHSLLVKKSKENGFTMNSFTKGHYEFSAVIQSNATKRFYYISVSDVRFFERAWLNHILWREMRHEKDWTGLQNRYATLDDLFNDIKHEDERKA